MGPNWRLLAWLRGTATFGRQDLAAKLIIKMNGYSDSPIDFSDYARTSDPGPRTSDLGRAGGVGLRASEPGIRVDQGPGADIS